MSTTFLTNHLCWAQNGFIVCPNFFTPESPKILESPSCLLPGMRLPGSGNTFHELLGLAPVLPPAVAAVIPVSPFQGGCLLLKEHVSSDMGNPSEVTRPASASHSLPPGLSDLSSPLVSCCSLLRCSLPTGAIILSL